LGLGFQQFIQAFLASESSGLMRSAVLKRASADFARNSHCRTPSAKQRNFATRFPKVTRFTRRANSPRLFNCRHGIEPNVLDLLSCAPRPNHFDLFQSINPAQAESDGQFGLRKVTARRHYLSKLGLASRADFDPSANTIMIAPCPNQLEPQPVVFQILIIAQ